jgi:transcriptional regulator with XRE-family HTH domain
MSDNQLTQETEILPATSKIVQKYRASQNLSLRGFAEALTEHMPGEKVTHSSVFNWEKGIHTPDYYFLVYLTLKTGDWRYDFAVDCLSVLNPKFYDPISSIGREAQKTI